jgi:hypothetical protein
MAFTCNIKDVGDINVVRLGDDKFRTPIVNADDFAQVRFTMTPEDARRLRPHLMFLFVSKLSLPYLTRGRPTAWPNDRIAHIWFNALFGGLAGIMGLAL